MTHLLDSAVVTNLAESWSGMIAPAAVKGSLLLALTGLLSLALRKASASLRHLLWVLGLAGVLVLPLLHAALPSWQIPGMYGGFSVLSGTQDSPVVAVETSSSAGVLEQSAPAAAPSTQQARVLGESRQIHAGNVSGPVYSSSRSLPLTTWIFFLWQAGVLLLAATVVWAAVRLWVLGRSAGTLTGDGWSELLESLCEELEIRRLPRLYMSEKTVPPMTWGIRRPKILLPRDCTRWTTEQRRQVLLHELAHVKRRDCLTQNIAQLACLFYWFNPFVWLAARKMRIERERACDDRVLVTGVRASSYASILLDFACARRSGDRLFAIGLCIARRCSISGRLVAVLDANRRRVAPRRHLTAIAAVLTLALTLPLAILEPTAEAGKPESATIGTLAILEPVAEAGRSGADTTSAQGIHESTAETGDSETNMTGAQTTGEEVAQAKESQASTTDAQSPPQQAAGPGKPKSITTGAAAVPRPVAHVREPELSVAVSSQPVLESSQNENQRSGAQYFSDTGTSYQNHTGERSLKAELQGTIRFKEDDTGIVWMDEGSRFSIEEKKKGRGRITLEAKAAQDGRPVYEYEIDGEVHLFDEDAVGWLREILVEVLTFHDINADIRVRRAYEQSGNPGVLELLDKFNSDLGRGILCREYFAMNGLGDDEIAEVLDHMSDRVTSSYEKASALVSYLENHLAKQGTWGAFLRCVSSVTSDHEKYRALSTAFGKPDLTNMELVVLLDAVGRILSHFEAAKVFASAHPNLFEDESNRKAYFGAFHSIGSEFEMAQVLVALAPYCKKNENLREACLEAAAKFGSQEQRNRVVKALE